uniref:SFRICE_037029 n=1 Tax=Spodoptera frugiperda TaxID=7108 RepID=A0A2H1WKH5_SPOFR
MLKASPNECQIVCSHTHDTQTQNNHLWITKSWFVRKSHPLPVARRPVAQTPHQPCSPFQSVK